MPTRTDRIAISVTFYAAVFAALLAILLVLFPLFLPEAVASRIGHNSEGLLLALILAAWIQYVRPRITGSDREWQFTAFAAALCLALGLFLVLTDLPSRFRTLNEPLFAAALLVPYVQFPRPLPGRLAGWLAAAVLAVTVLFNRTEVITNLAEMLGALILVPLALDVVDRGILDPAARTSRAVRYGWYAFLATAPIVFSVVQYQIGVDGLLGEAVRYAVRIAEAFVCLLLVQLYFAIGLRRTGRDRAEDSDTTTAGDDLAVQVAT